jgi:hypothetical protein
MLAIGAFTAPWASAQSAPPVDEWSHGTTLNIVTGANAASSRVGPFAGGAIGWELTPALGLEGTAAWLDRGRDGSAFAADLKALVSLAGRQTIAPFLGAGVGLYRASFDRPYLGMPNFYRLRMGGDIPEFMARSTFMDPSIVVSGGVNLFVTAHAAVRPELETKIVMAESRTYPVAAVGIRFTYHFEDHPITRVRMRFVSQR